MVNRLHVLRREHAHSSAAPAPPALGVRTVEQVDDVTAQETQVRRMMRCEVEERVGVTWPLGNSHRDENFSFKFILVLDQHSDHTNRVLNFICKSKPF